MTIDDYIADADCPELVDNANFTIIDEQGAEDDEWEDILEASMYDQYDTGWDDFADDWETHA